MAIKVGAAHQQDNRAFAVSYTVGVLRTAKDWQDGAHALADHPTIGPWLRGSYGADVLAEVQAIIRDAETELGDDLPY